ncbi:MAG: tRNA (5-methylaminomethyl-2-thiouridine)(34)-methyltransferase MnmD [Bacteroidales bacterium]
MKLEIVHTKDSSLTLYNKELDEHYHSVHGAKNESLHVFINSGLQQCAANPINIYEVGFGTGLNAYLAIEWAEKNKRKINYFAVEKYPLPKQIINTLAKQNGIDSELYKRIQAEECSTENVQVSQHANFRLVHDDCLSLDLSSLPLFDVIFFDAFAPDKEVTDKELWSSEHFKKIYEHSNEKGIFVSYCAKGAVRRALESVGYKMERIPGPVGKREMLRGRKLI